MEDGARVAAIAGVLQGLLEWLPVSSEGNLAIVLTAFGSDPRTAIGLALFLHLGTALSATVYYRDELRDVLGLVPEWRRRRAFEGGMATVTFLAVATLVSMLVGACAYLLLEGVVSELTGTALVGLVGVLLVLTGAIEWYADGLGGAERENPTLLDALLVGGAQGLAILPGVSRSGTTTSVLLLRGHDGPDSFRLSFLLSIPAAVGGGLVAVLDAGGLPSLSPVAALVALTTAAVVGYASIGVLMRLVRTIPFWGVCLSLGGLSIVGWFAATVL
ncbi:undecaprenyl-diphosphate phosphatase [Salinirubellus sp. GCM10025818]|uniref:undecaprenyl-diphosphate phosphatase n=1 Tax=Salinirubellus TaxID=2162630 RepID=UPI0030D5C388